MFFWIITSAIAGSLLSLCGGLFLLWRGKIIQRISLALVSFAAGSLLGAAFLDLLPESETSKKFLYALFGIVFFFLLEKLFIWHHCHDGKCEVQHYKEMVLFGDAVHNFIDGIIIAASFIVSIPLGIIVSLSVIAHEIPQEIGDFGVLYHGGMRRKNIIIFNVLTALATIIGAIATYFLASSFTGLLPFLLAFAAGGFIYIAAADLIPEIHKETKWKKTILQIILMIFGVLVIALMKQWLEIE